MHTPDLPAIPHKNDSMLASWGRAVAEHMRRMRLRAGPGLLVASTPEGQTISLAARSTPPSDIGDAPAGWPQWMCSLLPSADGGSWALSVGPGFSAWGGGRWRLCPGATIDLPADGAPLDVVWRTSALPDGGPAAGMIVAAPAPATRQKGWTDMHLLARLRHGADGAGWTLEQVQAAEVFAAPQEYPDEEEERAAESALEESAPQGGDCGDAKFPSDIDDIGWPAAPEYGAVAYPSKVGPCW